MLRLGGAFASAIAVLVVVATSPPATRADPRARRTVVLGRSVDGRSIAAVETGDLDARRRMLVVGCIHGNETAGIPVARWLARGRPPKELDLWIVPDLNPDGAEAGTRGNARGVDLNRNFPWRWRRLGGAYYSGRHALSERESRIAERLITTLSPDVSIWFHQHLDVVDESGGRIAVERHFARLAGLPLRRLARQPGSAVGWENHRSPSSTAFVVELPRGRLRPLAVRRLGRAVLASTLGS
jgi:murein peptide amidase A